jgi:hypothetical protein
MQFSAVPILSACNMLFALVRIGRRSAQDGEAAAAAAAAAAAEAAAAEAAAAAGPSSGIGCVARWAPDFKYRVEPEKGQRGRGVRYISYNDIRKVGVD